MGGFVDNVVSAVTDPISDIVGGLTGGGGGRGRGGRPPSAAELGYDAGEYARLTGLRDEQLQRYEDLAAATGEQNQ